MGPWFRANNIYVNRRKRSETGKRPQMLETLTTTPRLMGRQLPQTMRQSACFFEAATASDDDLSDTEGCDFAGTADADNVGGGSSEDEDCGAAGSANGGNEAESAEATAAARRARRRQRRRVWPCTSHQKEFVLKCRKEFYANLSAMMNWGWPIQPPNIAPRHRLTLASTACLSTSPLGCMGS